MRPIRNQLTIAAAVLAASFALGGAARAADVHVGVHVGVPAPPAIVFERPPRLIVVPGVPHVHYAPDVSVNFFSYGGRYYTYDDGSWFVADYDRGPWAYVERRHVPGVILGVPHRYYRVPPRLVGGGHWAHDRHWKKHDRGHGKKWHGNKHGKHGGKHHRHD